MTGAPRRAGFTVSGVDLHLDLTPGTGTGRRDSLIHALREAARIGRLAPGTRLPPSRTLAADLGFARNTVAEAYGQLVAEGWLVARQGSGTRVARRAEPPAGGGEGGRRAPRRNRPTHVRTPHNPSLDLRSGSPDPSSFPRAAWLASARRAMSAAPAEAFGHGALQGRPELRRALAGYLARARGVRADPDRILVCAGFVQGLAMLARVLPPAVAVEAYGLSFHRDLLTSAGLSTVPLTVDAHGARTGELAEHPDVRAALLTPAHQYPTGAPLSPDRRAAVIDWARRTDGLVLEDDYDGEFRYDRQPVGALQALDPERVVYLGTASKSLSPALRLAWMVLPEHLVDPVLAARSPAEWTTGVLDQLTLADFLESGAYDRHVRSVRQRYRRRRDRLAAAVAERAPDVRVRGIAAGLHAILELPARAEEFDLLTQAAHRGLALDALGGFRHPAAEDDGRRALVVGYGTPPEHGFPRALDTLVSVLRYV